MNDEIKQKCDDVLKHELKASELIEEVIRESDPDVSEDAMLQAVRDLLAKVEDPEREMTIYILAYRIGRVMESDKLVAFSEDKVEGAK